MDEDVLEQTTATSVTGVAAATGGTAAGPAKPQAPVRGVPEKASGPPPKQARSAGATPEPASATIPF
eukprot:1713239-Prorocentrum_lima.AAC.1